MSNLGEICDKVLLLLQKPWKEAAARHAPPARRRDRGRAPAAPRGRAAASASWKGARAWNVATRRRRKSSIIGSLWFVRKQSCPEGALKAAADGAGVLRAPRRRVREPRVPEAPHKLRGLQDFRNSAP